MNSDEMRHAPTAACNPEGERPGEDKDEVDNAHATNTPRAQRFARTACQEASNPTAHRMQNNDTPPAQGLGYADSGLEGSVAGRHHCIRWNTSTVNYPLSLRSSSAVSTQRGFL